MACRSSGYVHIFFPTSARPEKFKLLSFDGSKKNPKRKSVEKDGCEACNPVNVAPRPMSYKKETFYLQYWIQISTCLNFYQSINVSSDTSAFQYTFKSFAAAQCHVCVTCHPHTQSQMQIYRNKLCSPIFYIWRGVLDAYKQGQVCNAALILPHSPTGGHRLRTTKNASFHFSVSFHHQSHIVCPATEKDYVVSMRFSAIRLICSLEFHSFLHENTHCGGGGGSIQTLDNL